MNFPLPGAGDTWARFEAFSYWAAQDLSLGRLVEGHADAMGILAEAGMQPADPGATYGVWAARSRGDGTTARLETDGWHLAGQKPFCSGSGLLGSAVPLHGAVGGADFYLERPGFWFGAIGVAACWYGGAAGLVEHLGCTLDPSSSDLVLADFGHAVAHVEAMRHVLKDASKGIDADPADEQGQARLRAHVVRHAVHHGALQVLEHVAGAGGARPLCHDREQGQRAADLYVYLAQHHGSQDAAELGRIALAGRTWN
jgi:hypothetical protein